MALFYGQAGTTSLAGLYDYAASLGGEFPPLLLAGLGLMIVGFGFKVALVPFHMWTPDVYEGAPTSVTAFMAVAVKAAAFAAFARVMFVVFPEFTVQWNMVLWVLAVATMTLGNVVAIAQTNIKRMLAYSSIAQAGYVLIGVAAVSRLGVAAAVFYLGVYVLTNLAAFTTVILVTNKTGGDEIKDFAALGRRSPYLSLLMMLALLSLAGVPPLAGFFGKLFVFQAAIEAGLVRLAIIGVLNAIVGLYYYLIVIKVMFVDRCERPEDEEDPVIVPTASRWVLGVTTLGIIFLGVYATPWYDLASKAAEAFF